ncbi:C39 family peptidase [Candidatus Promineifilum breve]|nr:C39 family peptidase [Candidatus Promineifilum breve]
MVLAYSGTFRNQEELAVQLGVQPYLGAPARNIHRLAESTNQVITESGALETLGEWLNNDVPVIAFVQAGELPYWRGQQLQHAVVIVGIDQETVWILDPDTGLEPVSVGLDDFMLAWSELDNLCAIIT